MSGDAAARGSIKQPRQGRFPSLVEDCLRRFDHDLKSQRAFFQAQCGLHRFEKFCQRGGLLRDHDFGQRNHEIIRQTSVRRFAQRGNEKIERADASVPQFRRKRLDADSDEWRKQIFMQPTRHLPRGKYGVLIFFRVRAVSISILKIQPEILDGFPLKFFQHAFVNRERQPCRAIFVTQFFGRLGKQALRSGLFSRFWQGLITRQPHGARERERIRRVFLQGCQRVVAEPLRRARLEQMGPAVHGMNGLAAPSFARIAPRKRSGSGFQSSECGTKGRI